jgi:hypothetical protein
MAIFSVCHTAYSVVCGQWRCRRSPISQRLELLGADLCIKRVTRARIIALLRRIGVE